MSFTPFVFENTITSSQMNSNMSDIGLGNLYPRHGANLMSRYAFESETSNLGSETYKWTNIHCGGIALFGADSKNTWNLISENFLYDTVTSIEFTGLTASSLYKLEYILTDMGTNSSHYIALIFNGDSNANYSTEYIPLAAKDDYTSTLSFVKASLTNFVLIRDDTLSASNITCHGEILMSLYSDQIKFGIINQMGENSGSMCSASYGWFSWHDDESAVTTIKIYTPGRFYSSGDISGRINLWRLD
jgi:hypothetical protein